MDGVMRLSRMLLVACLAWTGVCGRAAAEDVTGQTSTGVLMIAQALSGGDAEEAKRREEARLRAEVRASLDGTIWKLELEPLGGEGRTQKDKVTFENDQVTSQRMSKDGYPSTNYAVEVKHGRPSWKTLQRKEGGDVVVWRGELYGETMAGGLTKQPVEGEVEHFSFTGTLVERRKPPEAASSPSDVEAAPSQPQEVLPAEVVPVEVVPVAERSEGSEAEEPDVPPAEVQAPEPKKKKKRSLFW